MPAKISGREIIAKLAIVLFLFAALLFESAGTLDWPEAWLFLIIYLAWAIPIVTWLKKNNPELLEERVAFFKKPVKDWDKTIMLLGTILFITSFLITGFDAVRYQWSRTPLVLKVLGFAGFIPAFILVFLVMRENTYLSRIVETQGHKVITTGPYKHVRHPMYVAAITVYVCIPLALGSLCDYTKHAVGGPHHYPHLSRGQDFAQRASGIQRVR